MNYQAIGSPQLNPENGWPLLWEQIRAVFPPTRPRDEFRFNLKRELLLAAKQKQQEQSLYPTPSREFLLFTAVLGFLVSVAGFLFARRRNGHVVLVSS
jgi:hypothetical protein